MKNKSFFLTLFSVLILLTSCEKTNESIYSSETDSINIWLGTKVSNPDSITHNFAYKSTNPLDSILFTARLVGEAVDYDRTFYLKTLSGDTDLIKEGIHYEYGTYILKANTHQTILPIYIKKTPDFKNITAKITFTVSEQGDLKSGIKELSRMTVKFEDAFTKPYNWDADVYPYTRLSTYFGAYTNTKFQFITTVIGQAPIFRVLNPGTPQEGEISFTEAKYFQSSCKKALNIYNAANEKPLKDEDTDESITFP